MNKLIATSITLSTLLTSNILADFNFDTLPPKLTAYYQSTNQNIDTIKMKLKSHGFTILSSQPILKEKTILTISNDELKATNSYMATLNLLIDNKNSKIRIQNPSYLGMAYLKDYKYGQFKNTLKALEKILGEMIPTSQQKESSKLPKYHFMFGMPYLEDTIIVAQGDFLHKKLKSSNILYQLKLSNGSTLVGHKLSNTTNSFLKKINQEKNAQMLPYQSIIYNKKATILDPKYYLALSLPLLSMSQFMKIASTPDDIEQEIIKAYK